MLGISSVLQPDPELGPQNTALASLFQILAPLIDPGVRPLRAAADGAGRQLSADPAGCAAARRRQRGRPRCAAVGAGVRPGAAARLAVRAGQHRLARGDRTARAPGATAADLFHRHAWADPRRPGAARRRVRRHSWPPGRARCATASPPCRATERHVRNTAAGRPHGSRHTAAPAAGARGRPGAGLARGPIACRPGGGDAGAGDGAGGAATRELATRLAIIPCPRRSPALAGPDGFGWPGRALAHAAAPFVLAALLAGVRRRAAADRLPAPLPGLLPRRQPDQPARRHCAACSGRTA